MTLCLRLTSCSLHKLKLFQICVHSKTTTVVDAGIVKAAHSFVIGVPIAPLGVVRGATQATIIVLEWNGSPLWKRLRCHLQHCCFKIFLLLSPYLSWIQEVDVAALIVECQLTLGTTSGV